VLRFEFVLIFIVFITDIERRIGKSEIDGAVGDFPKTLDAIAVKNVV
jgi:hypothetical protein